MSATDEDEKKSLADYLGLEVELQDSDVDNWLHWMGMQFLKPFEAVSELRKLLVAHPSASLWNAESQLPAWIATHRELSKYALLLADGAAGAANVVTGKSTTIFERYVPAVITHWKAAAELNAALSAIAFLAGELLEGARMATKSHICLHMSQYLVSHGIDGDPHILQDEFRQGALLAMAQKLTSP